MSRGSSAPATRVRRERCGYAIPGIGPSGRESAALWCTVVDRDLGQRPAVVKQVFGAFPPEAAAGPGRFRGEAAMAGRTGAGT